MTPSSPIAPAALAERLAPLAAGYDRENRFAHESIRILQEAGYAALTVPEAYGGSGAGLLELVRAQELVAQGDAAVALAIGMSLIKLVQQAIKPSWPAPIRERVMRAAATRGALVNSVASEPRLGSPSRGGTPETVAVPVQGGGWKIRGHKTFATLAPLLDFIIVTATIEDAQGGMGRFLVERGPAIRVEENWEALGMRATGSHDMHFEDAPAAPDALLSRTGGSAEASSEPPSGNVPAQNPFFALPIAAVYLGAAGDAHRAAVQHARQRVPSALGHPLAELPRVRALLADNERELRVARTLLHDGARRVDACAGVMDDELRLAIYVAKHTATNNALTIVDRAMRIVGGAALAQGSVLERAYRNVRAGLLHPPGDDITSNVLAAWTLRAHARSAERP